MTPRSNNDPTAERTGWTIFGAGRLGLGVLAPLASELKMSSLLVVAGENTSRETVERYNSESDYKVMLDKPPHELMVSDYRVVTRSEVADIVDSIADLNTRIVSTSVGDDRLSEVLPILAAGLRKRFAQHGTNATATGLVLLICENGRGRDGQPRAITVREELREMLAPTDLNAVVEMPTVVLDSIVPQPPDTSLDIKVSLGDIWIEETERVRELFGISANINLASPDQLSLIHTRKLYCVNTMHLLLSVAGAITGEETIDRIATDGRLKACWAEIARSLAAATCEPNGRALDAIIGDSSTSDYAQHALVRMQKPAWSDHVDRAMAKLRRGWYLDDGRIDGPVTDAGLVEEPHGHPALVHAIALVLYSVVNSINALAVQFACVPSDSPVQAYEQSVKWAFASGLALAAKSPFTDNQLRTPLVEALARDFQWLSERQGTPLNTATISEFLRRPISTNLQALPRRAGDIRCVMFDLDEGLVATESLLFRVTRELIEERSSHDGIGLTHDTYAEHVGSPELEFFRKMISAFQIKSHTPEALVKEREERFLETLTSISSQMLVKPGFRSLLDLLDDRNVDLVVCSNASDARVRATLEHAGISMYFESVITPSGEFLPKGSPGTPMYEMVRRKLNHKQDACIVVESSLVGVSAAVEAGLYTLLVVNDYTKPKRAARAGVKVLGNAQMLQMWFTEHWDQMSNAA